MMSARTSGLGLFLAASLLLSCADATQVRLCTTRDECGGDVCINGRCEPFDAGRDAQDAATDGPETPDSFTDDSSLPVFDGGAQDAGPAPDAGTDAFMPGPCGAAPCGMWVLEDRARAWDPLAAPGGAAAPGTPVRAAFDIESLGIAYVLTDTTTHTLRLSDRTYVEAGSRGREFPELSGTLRAAASIPAGHAGSDPTVESATLLTDAGAFIYEYDLASGSFSYVTTVTDLGPEWDARLAPTPSAVGAAWLALEDDEGWTTGSPMDSCGRPGSRFSVYVGYLASAVHVFDAGSCAAFVQRTGYVTFPPFTRGGAPELASIAASFYNDGELWLLAE